MVLTLALRFVDFFFFEGALISVTLKKNALIVCGVLEEYGGMLLRTDKVREIKNGVMKDSTYASSDLTVPLGVFHGRR